MSPYSYLAHARIRRISEEDGDDRLNARDQVRGKDSASGGPGRDTCTADRGDPVSGCQ